MTDKSHLIIFPRKYCLYVFLFLEQTKLLSAEFDKGLMWNENTLSITFLKVRYEIARQNLLINNTGQAIRS